MLNVQTAQDVHGDEVVIINKKDAKAAGLDSYFTGKPCKHGHISIRRVSNGHCVECKQNIDRSGRADGVKAANNVNQRAVVPMPVLDDTALVDLGAVDFDTVGIETETLTKQEWTSLAQVADKTKSFRSWIIGDLWNRCEWGDKAVMMDSLGINPKSAREYGRICSRIPHDMRRANLSFGHHAELCVQAVETEEQMVSLLDRVETNGMSVADTRRAVKDLIGRHMIEGQLEGGEDDGTEGAEAFNPFYGLKAKIDQVKEAIDTFADDDIQRIEQFKSWLDELVGSDVE